MPYTIGEVARMMNIAPSTLRYYEKEGLLSLGVRASNGQRTYTDDDIATLSIIEYLKFCGLPLKEIRSFLPLIRPGGETLSARRDILAKEFCRCMNFQRSTFLRNIATSCGRAFTCR